MLQQNLYDFWESDMIGGLHKEDYAKYVRSEVFGGPEQFDNLSNYNQDNEDAYTLMKS